MINDNDLSEGFDAGNYANAYDTTDLEQAISSLSPNRSEAYIDAFILGFFSSYAPHEMAGYENTYLDAYYSVSGTRCVELGYVDTIETDESAD